MGDGQRKSNLYHVRQDMFSYFACMRHIHKSGFIADVRHLLSFPTEGRKVSSIYTNTNFNMKHALV
jgi:hypothetical protein